MHVLKQPEKSPGKGNKRAFPKKKKEKKTIFMNASVSKKCFFVRSNCFLLWRDRLVRKT